MIINVSGRTDICAYYSKWFMNRLKEGYVDVRNPFNEKAVSRIYMENVDAILFCTKNPIPMVEHLDEIDKPMVFHVTITGYHKDMEPNVPDKRKIIEAVKTISAKIGRDNVFVRYDPIFLSKRYNLAYHIRAFEKLLTELDGAVGKICASFLDLYKNTQKHQEEIGYLEMSEEDYKVIGENFSRIAAKYNTQVFCCHEGHDLVEYGFIKDACMSQKKAFELTGKALGKWKARQCGCVELVDIGYYNSCNHLCKYCYANFDEKRIQKNMLEHDPESSLLIGHLQKDDIIKVRRK